jgi:sec-independent protein translocase protein TatA
MFGIGTTELLIVLGVILLLFGNRLPGTMRSLGRSLIEFKRGLQGSDESKPQTKPEMTTAGGSTSQGSAERTATVEDNSLKS